MHVLYVEHPWTEELAVRGQPQTFAVLPFACVALIAQNIAVFT